MFIVEYIMYDTIFLTKGESTVPYNLYKEWMGGELYVNPETKLGDLLEGDSEKRLLPGEYSLYMWGPLGTSLWIRNNNGVLQFHEYYDRDIYAEPQDKYMNAFKNGYEERKLYSEIVMRKNI